MSKAYQDKETGLWKWGKRGIPMYESKIECERKSLEILTDRLRQLKEKIAKGYIDYGK